MLEIHKSNISFVTDATEDVRKKLIAKSAMVHSASKLAQIVKDNKRWGAKKAEILHRIKSDQYVTSRFFETYIMRLLLIVEVFYMLLKCFYITLFIEIVSASIMETNVYFFYSFD